MHVLRALLLTAAAALLATGCSTSSCNAATCSGCCNGNVCLSGDSAQACGSSGRACAACGQGDVCFFNVCAHQSGGPGGGGGSGGGSGGGGGGTGGGNAQPSTRFDTTATIWPVPDSTTATGFYAPLVSNNGSQWATVDLDGDGRPDLVQTADPASVGPTPWLGAGTTGGASWRVYKNTGQGFATTPMVWSLPGQVSTVDYSAVNGLGAQAIWSTVDLDGDKKPDLVRTADPSAGKMAFDGGVAGAYWEVYFNTGSGFSATPVQWHLPASGLPAGFWTTAAAGASENWGLYDLDGDGVPELVQTSDPATNNGVFLPTASGGSPYWKVFKKSGMGFSTTFVQWPVPAGTTAGGFYVPFAAGPLRNWGLFDLDGDRAPELVETSDPTQVATVFGPSPSWSGYANTHSGFASAAVSYSVPESGTDGGFYAAASLSPPSGWATLDLDGDGHVDLVQTADPAQARAVFGDADGGSHWQLFSGAANGFGAARSFAVPASGTTAGFCTLIGLGGQEHWVVIDLDGDGRPDLVQTSNPAANDQVFVDAAKGASWRVFRGLP